MTDKSEYMKVASAQLFRVVSKKENNQTPFEFSDNKKKKTDDDNEKNNDTQKEEINHLDSIQLIELGRLLLSKRNTELKLFVRIKKNTPTENSFFSNIDSDVMLIKSKLAEIDKNIADINFYHSNSIVEDEEDNTINKLNKLDFYYGQFLEFAISEDSALNNDDIDALEIVLREKESVLTHIEQLQKNIDFNIFKKYPPDYPKKVKANDILVDIQSKMNQIVKIEDQNSVKLQNTMEDAKTKICEQENSSKKISQYASQSTKSYFIDTTK
jgi:hypothetical protein